MRPPMAKDHVNERRLRVVLLEKYPPYNKGEEKGLPESQARRLCVNGTAIPAPKRKSVQVRDPETGEFKDVEDKLGGWKLTPDEQETAASFRRARRISAGDLEPEIEAQQAATAAEETRVEAEAEAEGDSNKPTGGGFLKGGKKNAKPEAKK